MPGAPSAWDPRVLPLAGWWGGKAVTQRPELLRALHTTSKASYTNYPITRLPLAFGTADPSALSSKGSKDAPGCCAPSAALGVKLRPYRHFLG